jgi:hypothetical protein
MNELKLISQHPAPIHSLVENALQDALNSTENGIRQTEQRLQEFESKYQISTIEFIRRYENDEIQETLEIDEWIGEYRMLNRLTEKAERLRGIKIAN